MIMADILKIALLIAGTLAVFICYWLAGRALFPDFVDRASEQYRVRPFKATLLGLAVLIPLLIVAGIIAKPPHPAMKLLSGCFSIPPLVLGLVGAAGLAQRIGNGLPTRFDDDQPWRRTLRGGVVLSLTFLMPIFGWFVLLPWAIVSGFGVFLLCLARSPRAAVPPMIPTAPVAA